MAEYVIVLLFFRSIKKWLMKSTHDLFYLVLVNRICLIYSKLLVYSQYGVLSDTVCCSWLITMHTYILHWVSKEMSESTKHYVCHVWKEILLIYGYSSIHKCNQYNWNINTKDLPHPCTTTSLETTRTIFK